MCAKAILVKKYVENFQKSHKQSSQYSIRLDDLFSAASKTGNDLVCSIATVFDYGYAKGYRAAQAEMQKAATK